MEADKGLTPHRDGHSDRRGRRGGRGCAASCEYCTHAAAERLSGAAVSGSGQRRDLSDLADEMARLYHDDGVRHFSFSDENIVLLSERAALEWAGAFKETLTARDVTDASLSFMTRADAITEPVANALVRLGLIRTLVGVESATSHGLTALGRAGSAEKGRRGLALLVERNVVTLFNDMLFHPETAVESVAQEIVFLRGIKGALFDTVQAVPFVGTSLSDRLSREGRLQGGRIVSSFAMINPVLERLKNFVTRLQSNVFGSYNPTLRANDLLFSAALAVENGIRPNRAAEIACSLDGSAKRINQIRLDVLEALLHAAMGECSADEVLCSSKERFDAVTGELDRAERLLRQ